MDLTSHQFISCVDILSMKTVLEDKDNAVDVDSKCETLSKEKKGTNKVLTTKQNFSKCCMKEKKVDLRLLASF